MSDEIDLPDNIFYDGKTARAHHVEITLDLDSFQITAATMDRPVNWTYTEMRIVVDIANQKGASFRVAGGAGRLDIADNELAQRFKNLAPNLSKTDIPASAWKRIGLWGAGAAASVVVIIFVIIPALANQLATMIPVKREIVLGNVSLRQIERLLALDNDTLLTCTGQKGQAALDKMITRLEAHLDSPYPLDVRIFNNDVPNAFAVPGGHIVLFDGLVQAADSPEEVAAVLGHEMGHVINRDPIRLTLRAAGSVGILGMVFGDFAGGAAALVVAERLIAADYSQQAEADADEFAHNLMADAGLPSKPMADFFNKLYDEYGDEPGFLSHLASHPDLVGRANAAIEADTIGDSSFEAILTATEWDDLRQICAN